MSYKPRLADLCCIEGCNEPHVLLYSFMVGIHRYNFCCAEHMFKKLSEMQDKGATHGYAR